jgi:hypothetical protein
MSSSRRVSEVSIDEDIFCCGSIMDRKVMDGIRQLSCSESLEITGSEVYLKGIDPGPNARRRRLDA